MASGNHGSGQTTSSVSDSLAALSLAKTLALASAAALLALVKLQLSSSAQAGGARTGIEKKTEMVALEGNDRTGSIIWLNRRSNIS